jgi:hypothetical protein
VWSRIAGRAITSPFAFLFAGILDFALFAGATIGRGLCSVSHCMRRAVPKIERS